MYTDNNWSNKICIFPPKQYILTLDLKVGSNYLDDSRNQVIFNHINTVFVYICQ